MTCQEPVERRGHTQPCDRPLDKGETLCAVHLRRQAVLSQRPPRPRNITTAAKAGRKGT